MLRPRGFRGAQLGGTFERAAGGGVLGRFLGSANPSLLQNSGPPRGNMEQTVEMDLLPKGMSTDPKRVPREM